MITVDGADFWYDPQIGTFMAKVNGTVYGKYSGHLPSAVSVANEVGMILPNEFLLQLEAEKNAALVSSNSTVRYIPKEVFLHRFTEVEQLAILAAAKTSVAIERYLFLIQARAEIDLLDPTISEGLHKLELAGILTSGRTQEILMV